MEAQETLFRRGSPTLQTSLTFPELPPYPRHFRSEDFFRFLKMAGIWGKFLFGAGGANALYGAASRPIGRREAFGNYALRECRDSACRHTRKVSCLTASHPQKACDSRTLQKNSTSPNTKKLPPYPRHFQKAKQIFTSEMAGLWGKFSVREGGLEGESPIFQEGALSLQGLSSPSPAQNL